MIIFLYALVHFVESMIELAVGIKNIRVKVKFNEEHLSKHFTQSHRIIFIH